MTLEEAMQTKLYQHGLFPDQAAAVMAQVKALPNMDAVRWSGDEHQYDPAPVKAIVWMECIEQAKIWLKTNHPHHWALAMFEVM